LGGSGGAILGDFSIYIKMNRHLIESFFEISFHESSDNNYFPEDQYLERNPAERID
jgi:hypothetical protein